jgi:phosphoribosylamine-glycine ligase
MFYIFTDLSVKDFDSVVTFCQTNSVSLVVVGPEDPLAAGIADHLQENGNIFIKNKFLTQFSKWKF